MSSKTKKEAPKKHHRGERTVSSWIIFLLMAVFLVFMWTPYRAVYTAILGLVSAMACYEVLHAVKAGNKLLYGVAMAASAFVPFVFSYSLSFPVSLVITCYVMLLLIIMVTMNASTRFVDILAALYSSLWIPFGFSCFVLIRNIYIQYPGKYLKWEGFLLVMLVFGCSWAPDGLAYLVGKRFGKHKLAPVISPKKSIEGAVGGVLITSVLVLPVFLLYSFIIKSIYGDVLFASAGSLKYLYVFLFVFGMSIISIFGDLAASVIKRNFNIKDYSSLFPGHGGIMDRFDSSLFVLPSIYALITVLNM